jgi:hypothetical protein
MNSKKSGAEDSARWIAAAFGLAMTEFLARLEYSKN